MKNDSYIVVLGWMLTELRLNGNELLAYALIYGYSQDMQGGYYGSLQQTADKLNISRRAVVGVLARLVEKGHIIKSNVVIDGIERCLYRAVALDEAEPPKPPKREASHVGQRFVAPTLAEVEEYCRQRGNKVDAQRFVDFYSANGWVQGRGKPIKDWRAAVRTWEYEHKNNSNGHRIDKECIIARRREESARELELLDAEYRKRQAAANGAIDLPRGAQP